MHNSTGFKATTNNIKASLASDFWVIINRWQDAADSGYGLYENWGEVIDVNLLVFDWVCESLLRRLIAISVFSYLIVADLLSIYIDSGRAAAHWSWIKEYGIPGAIQGLDALVSTLLCYQEPEVQPAHFRVEEIDFSESNALIIWANTLK